MQAICRILKINRSSYYAWLNRPLSERSQKDELLSEKLQKLHDDSKKTYGSPRLTAQLKAQGLHHGRKRIAQLMKKRGIFGCASRKFRPCTTKADPTKSVSPRIFESQNKRTLPKAPNQVWVGDMTYIPTQEGWLYLTSVLDVFNRKIVGYCMSDHMKAETAWDALKMGVYHQSEAFTRGKSSFIFHSDRGSQYSSDTFREKIELLRITQSMSRKGNCYDNAYMKSFFHTLKVELVNRRTFQSRAEARAEIEDYIENWYNTKRLHSALGYKTPHEYERESLAA